MGYDWTDDALKFTQARLQTDPSTVPTIDWKLEIQSISNALADRYESVLEETGGVDGLSDKDKLFWAEGVGNLVALRLRPVIARNVANGDIVSVKLAQQEFHFAGNPRSGKPAEQQWLDDAVLAIGRVSPIRALYRAAAAAFNPFLLSGPTRAAKSTGLHETLMSGLVRLLTDDWNADTDSESGVGV